MALAPEQRRIVRKIKRRGNRAGATPKEKLAAVETGLVESGLRNLPGGDADSAGWRQERASLYRNPTNLNASIDRFFRETRAVRGKYSNAGDLAAAVQRPAAQYRGRYQERAGEARRLLGSVGGGGGGGGARTTTTRVPGTSNKAARGQLIASFLGDKDSDVLDFALGMRGLKDTPGRTVTKRRRNDRGKVGHRDEGPVDGSEVKELFWQGAGGVNLKNGEKVPQGFVSGHEDHVHVAAGPKTVVALGRKAQQMGLHVGENSHFGGATPTSGHAANSYHYRDEAIDVSGDANQMRQFAHYVERYQRNR